MTDDQSHGSPFDRGSADSWYRRPKYPHYKCPKTGKTILANEMTDEQLKQYESGYQDNEKKGGRKEYQ